MRDSLAGFLILSRAHLHRPSAWGPRWNTITIVSYENLAQIEVIETGQTSLSVPFFGSSFARSAAPNSESRSLTRSDDFTFLLALKSSDEPWQAQTAPRECSD